MTRVRAALTHLGISVIVFALFLSLVFFVWYAWPFNLTQGIAEIVYLMAGVDVVLGPLLTLIVFKAGKKGLKFDLTMIGLVQVAALIYGAYVIYSERPAYVPFAVDRFEVVGINEIDANQIPNQDLKIGIFDKPRLIYVERPIGEEASTILFEVMSGGVDIERRPKFYRDYQDYARSVVVAAKPLSELTWVDTATLDQENLVFLPVKGKKRDIIALINKQTAEIEGYLLDDPWPKK